ncbi:MAG: biliverdin-producing heme oxygenase [Paracoccaceae bacterium]
MTVVPALPRNWFSCGRILLHKKIRASHGTPLRARALKPEDMSGQEDQVTQGSMRWLLFAATRDMHDRLDSLAGPLSDLVGYRRYLAATLAFRQAIEPALRRADGWQVQDLVEELRCDADDLQAAVLSPPHTPPFETPSQIAGALYVAEGSALGARVVQRRAQALGLTDRHGARHLSAQTAEKDRWPHFLTWLESGHVVPDEAMDGARRAFSLALSAYDLADADRRVVA